MAERAGGAGDEEMVTLISMEGHEFIVHRKAAMISSTIKSILTATSTFREEQTNEVRFPEISADILEKVCQYFYYKLKFSNSTDPIPKWDVDPPIALDLLIAAHYLNC
eukprot:Rmarinus@m.23876